VPEQQYLDLARATLFEMTPEDTVGDLLSEVREEDGSITVTFESKLAGYPGWTWAVSLAHVEGLDPTVLEAELIPGDGALLAPDWVPWSERLADYKAAQEAADADAAAAAVDAADADSESDEDDEDDDLDDDDLDDDDLDDEGDEDDDEDLLGSDVLHGGDLDGVDIDDLDVSARG
jgi:hypothetical protein